MRPTRSVLAVTTALVLITSLWPAAAAAQEEARFRALVFSKVTNFFHESIPAGKAAIEALGEEHDFEVVVTDDASIFNDADLATFDVVVFNNTNSTPEAGALLDAEQRAAFERYVQAGGGWVGLHSASGTEREWAWYEGLVGAIFSQHPPGQLPDGTIPGRVDVTDRVHPSTAHLPEVWRWDEEWYNFTTDPTGNVHVLASVDTGIGIDGLTLGPDHPISWCQEYDGGRSWYTALGHSPQAFSDDDFLGHVLGGMEWAAGVADGDCGATVDDSYVKTLLARDLTDPMELAVAPDGRVLVAERGGGIQIWNPETNLTTSAGQLDVSLDHTHGLNGLTLDPDFADNGWVYLYWSPDGGVGHRLSRFTLVGDTLDLDSEQVLLEIPTQHEHNGHEAGSMTWDPAGNLYLATGDNTLPSEYAPIDERPGNEAADAQRSSGNTNDLRGKILRIHPEDDGTYSIPEGNLFPPGEHPADLTRPEIYAMGLRQPYRLHYDAATGRLLWGDVGEDAHVADPERGPIGLDDFYVTTEPGNFGWPYCNGQGAYRDYDYATGESGELFDCEGGPVNDSPNNTGLEQLPPVRWAQISYPYDWSNHPGDPVLPELGNGGRLAIAGPVYRYDAELESDTKFPAYFDGKWFLAEWERGWIRTASIADAPMTFDDYPDIAAGDVWSTDPWLTSETFLRPHDLEFGPDGSLYLLEWGSNYGGAGRGDPNNDSGLYRIDYVKGNRPPVARASATPTSGAAPLEVAFSSEGTHHPDELASTLEWRFGDGATSTEAHPTHTYSEPGDYTAQLVVTDAEGRTAVANVTVTVGNTRPVVEVVWPPEGGFVGEGDTVEYTVEVTDAEDGSTAAGTIDCDRVTVQPWLGHDEHAHPLQVLTGCTGSYAAEFSAGHAWHDDYWPLFTASYTDEGGNGAGALTGSDQVRLQPKRKQAEHYTDASGIQPVAMGPNEGSAEQLGGTVVGHVSDGDWVAYEPVNLAGVDALSFHVNSAGAGGTIEARAGAPDGPLVADPVAVPNTGTNWRGNFVDVTTQIRDDAPTDPFTLYLAFSNDQVADNLFNLHWIDVEGDGVSQSSTDVEVSGISVDGPLYGGRQQDVTVTLDAIADATVTVDVDAPDGWTTTPQEVTVPAGEVVEVAVPVTPPAAPAFTTLTARVAGDGVVVDGAPGVSVASVPHGDDAVLALDGGTPTSPVLDSYSRLSSQTAWTAGLGYGWASGSPQDRDRGNADALRRDMVAAPSPATLRLDVPAGEHTVWMLRGDPSFAAVDTIVEVDGQQVIGGNPSLPAGEFAWASFPLDGGPDGRTVELDLSAPGTEFWRINALVVLAEDSPPPPVPTVSASLAPPSPDGADGWYVSPVTVTLTADDPEAVVEVDTGSGWTPYDGPLTIDADGVWTVSYRASNATGTSPAESRELRIDRTAPTVTGAVEGEGTGEVTVTLTAEDGDGSGVAEVHYRMAGDTEFSEYGGPASFTEPGEYTLEFRAADNAGNASDWKSVAFTVVDESAACPEPDGSDTVVIGDDDTGIPNVDTGDGCTIDDLLDDEGEWANRGLFVRHVSLVTRDLYADGMISARDRAGIVRAAARSDVADRGRRR